MDSAVRIELDALLGYMRACRRTIDAIDAGRVAPPTPPGSSEYVVEMTWAQARGSLQTLEHLGLISATERREWEDLAAELVAPLRRSE
jgi:hypothetical protein